MNRTICESTNIKVGFLKNEYRILNCKDCNHLFTDLILTTENVDLIYSDDYFFGGGAGYDDYTLQKDMLIRRGEYYTDKIKAGRELGLNQTLRWQNIEKLLLAS